MHRSGRVVPLLLDVELRSSTRGRGAASGASIGRPGGRSPLQPQEPRAASADELHPTPPGSVGPRCYAWLCGRGQRPRKSGTLLQQPAELGVSQLPPRHDLWTRPHTGISISPGQEMPPRYPSAADGWDRPLLAVDRWAERRKDPPDGQGIRARSDRVPWAATPDERGAQSLLSPTLTRGRDIRTERRPASRS